MWRPPSRSLGERLRATKSANTLLSEPLEQWENTFLWFKPCLGFFHGSPHAPRATLDGRAGLAAASHDATCFPLELPFRLGPGRGQWVHLLSSLFERVQRGSKVPMSRCIALQPDFFGCGHQFSHPLVVYPWAGSLIDFFVSVSSPEKWR